MRSAISRANGSMFELMGSSSLQFRAAKPHLLRDIAHSEAIG
jgi:hypothetical protein